MNVWLEKCQRYSFIANVEITYVANTNET